VPKTAWSAAKYAAKEEPGRNGWLTRFRAKHTASELPEVDLGTNENGEASMSRKRRGTWVTVRTHPDGTVHVLHGATEKTRRLVAIIPPPDEGSA
jgi:hypothetical protein